MVKKMKFLLIIPAYNEEDCILNTIKKIDTYNKTNKLKVDYIVINDGSTDNTEKILKENKINHIKLLNNLGIGGAVQSGYKYAFENDYDIAIQFDGDGQHDINYVNNLIKPIVDEKVDMTIGSRFVVNDKNNFKSTFTRRIGINLISFIIKFLTRKKIFDPTSGYRAVNKNIIKFFSENYPFEYPEPVSEVALLKRNYKIKEVYVKMYKRQGGKSSIHAWKNVYYMINVTIAMIIESIKR